MSRIHFVAQAGLQLQYSFLHLPSDFRHVPPQPATNTFFFNAMEVFLSITGFVSMTPRPHSLLWTHTQTAKRKKRSETENPMVVTFFLVMSFPK